MSHTRVTVRPRCQARKVTERSHPWRELRGREHLVVGFHPMAGEAGGAFYFRRGGRAAIVIDPRLGRRRREAALAHELIHDEWGPCQHHDHVITCREEARVRAEVARWLVPLELLEEMASQFTEIGTLVDAHLVAEWFDVTEDVAQLALELLGGMNGREPHT